MFLAFITSRYLARKAAREAARHGHKDSHDYVWSPAVTLKDSEVVSQLMGDLSR